MENRRNHYRLLKVQPDAPVEVIQASYRTLMAKLKHHPDLGGSTATAAMLNEAYRVLSNRTLRAQYDANLFSRYSRQSVAAARVSESAATASSCPLCRTPRTRESRAGERCVTCGTPLQPAGEAGSGRLPCRAMTRIPRDAPITYSARWPLDPRDARMIDFAPAGIRFLCREKLVPGTVLHIAGPGFEASAVVKSCRAPGAKGGRFQAVGVAFLAVDFDNPRGSFLSTTA